MAALRPRAPDELECMRRAGRVVAEMHAEIRAALVPGATTGELDAIGREILARHGATSNFLGYHGFPAVVCTSVNEVVIHGIPGDRVLRNGDLVSVDCGAIVEGWHADAAFSAGVGEVGDQTRGLIAAAEAALAEGIAQLVPGNRIGDCSAAVQRRVEADGFSVVREYVGHGIGRAMHEPPDVPNVGRAGRGPRLAAGVTLAVEPMVLAGAAEVVELDDGWSVVTRDGSLAAHAEHTVVVSEGGAEIFTAGGHQDLSR